MGRYTDKKVNNTPKAKKLKKELEKLGQKNVEVWSGTEMSGYEGGWVFYSGDEEESYFDPCLGYNFEEALENKEKLGNDLRKAVIEALDKKIENLEKENKAYKILLKKELEE